MSIANVWAGLQLGIGTRHEPGPGGVFPWRAWEQAVLVALALPSPSAGASVGMRRASPGSVSFYRLPAELPPAPPGTVIRTAPYRAFPGARAWKVLYHSLALDGRDIAVSGVVVAPVGAAPSGGSPVVSWAHGTRGIADVCAPSRRADWVAQLPGVRELISQGFVVAATDYEGLGTAGVHPYLVGESEARGMLDVVRAAGHLPNVSISPSTFLYGHSQGGQAALFAGEIAPTYAPELQILGIIAGAPAAEIEAMLPAAAGTPSSVGYVVMALAGAHAAYPDADLSDVLTPAAVAKTKVLQTHCYEDVIKEFREPVTNVIAQNPADVPSFAEIMAREYGRQRAEPCAPLRLPGLERPCHLRRLHRHVRQTVLQHREHRRIQDLRGDRPLPRSRRVQGRCPHLDHRSSQRPTRAQQLLTPLARGR